MTNIAGQQYWDKSFSDVQFAPIGSSDEIRLWIRDHLRAAEGGSCLEVGCYPGRYLPVFGELGYQCFGVDLQENVAAIGPWLNELGLQTGNFWREDFLTFEPGRHFDVVASFGFIEHFTNWEDVFQKHMNLVSEGGTLVLAAPNFQGWLQHWLHSLFDKEDLAFHYVPSMDVKKWVDLAEAAGFEVQYSGYFKRFDFWVGKGKRNLFARTCLLFLRGIRRPLGFLLPKNQKAYSPFLGIIAKKLPSASSKSQPGKR